MTESTEAQRCNSDGFSALVRSMQHRLDATTASNATLLTVDTREPLDLFDVFLSALSPTDAHSSGLGTVRSHYTCNACRQFVYRFGGLVVVDDAGNQASAVWSRVADLSISTMFPTPLQAALVAVRRHVETTPVSGVHVSSEKTWGTPEAGGWSHFAVTPAASQIHVDRVKTAGQRAAELREDRGSLQRALAEYPKDLLVKAHGMLRDGVLYRAEKAEALAKWMVDLHTSVANAVTPRHASNLVWRAVAEAPAGWCHVRSGMLGTLLDDLAADLPVEQVNAKWAAKMDPLAYMRPTVVKAGNVKAAEDLVEKLGIRASLRRRFATLDDVRSRAMWLTPADRVTDYAKAEVMALAHDMSTKVFGHLLAGAKSRVVVPTFDSSATMPVKMTWEKFSRDVLHDAKAIQFASPGAGVLMPYGALVTAADPDAPPIVKWDSPDDRNPLTWYVYVGGSQPSGWSLPSSGWVDVRAVLTKPSMWPNRRDLEGCGKGLVFVLDGARDRRKAKGTEGGGGLFPEDLKSDLHAVRSTIEAHMRQSPIEGIEVPDLASGLLLSAGAKEWINVVLRVLRSDGTTTCVRFDRWD